MQENVERAATVKYKLTQWRTTIVLALCESHARPLARLKNDFNFPGKLLPVVREA